jgi:hypothetical protein
MTTSTAGILRQPFDPGASRRNRRHFLLPVLLVFVLGGCFSVKFLYNQMDWFTVWYINDLFDLRKDQKEELRSSVERILDWHRTSQLPEYAEFCLQLEKDAAGTLTPEVIGLRYDEMIRLWDELLLHAMPEIGDFFLSLDQEQVDDFLVRVEEENEELWAEYGGRTAEERIKRRTRAAIKGTQRLTGKLSRSQKEIVGAYMATLADNAEKWIERRRKWQSEFHALLENRSDESQFRQQLSALMIDPNRFDGPDYRTQVERNRQIVFAMLADVAANLSDRQQAQFNRRLRDFAADFTDLAEMAPL